MDVTKGMPGLAGPAGAQVEEELGEAGVERETPVQASKGNLPAGRGVFKALLLLLLLSRFSRVRLCATPQTAASRPWDSPGKNTGVG